jgi:phage terminase large subunit
VAGDVAVDDPDALAAYALYRVRQRTEPIPQRPVEFANDQQREFFESQAPEVLYSGAMGAGKSRILCEKAWDVACRFPGVTVGIFRKVAASLASTTERTFWTEVADTRRISSRNKSESWLELDNGSRVYFMGLDADPVTGVPSKVGSLNLGAAYVDEAIELNSADWTMLQGRLRDPHIPWHQLGAATNPGPPKHWLRLRFYPPTEDRVYLHATAHDNRFVPEDYLRRIAELPDDAYGRRLGKGEWVGAEGVIWQLPDAQVHDVPGPWKRVVAGVDWGFVHAFACEVIGQSGSGRLHVIDEVYQRGRTIDQIIGTLQLVRELHGITKFYADPSEPAYILQCQRAGLPVEEARNDVAPGIGAVSMAIAQGMTVSPACRGLLEELPGYVWAPNRAGGYHERPVEQGDDACDALRYGVVALNPTLDENPWSALAGQRIGGVA